MSGDSRFDRVLENKENASENPVISKFKGNNQLLIIGSSWPQDEKILLPWIHKTNCKILIAPHNVDENHVGKILKEIPSAIRYSEVNDDGTTEAKVMILDTIGQLSNAYAYGNIAYVGGGFSGNLHNILEPAVFGIPVIFGPKHQRFPEGEQFINAGFGYSVSTTNEFESAYNAAVMNIDELRIRISKFFVENGGSTELVWNHIISN